MEREYHNECGFCPRCCSDDLKYSDRPTFDGDGLFFTYHCNNCDLDGEEWYYVEFTGHNFCDYDEDGNGEEVDLRG